MKRSAGAIGLVPAGVVTRMSTEPVPAGAVAVIELAELTVKLLASTAPNLTAVAPARFPPLIVTEVPPESGARLGTTLVTTGIGSP